MTGAFSRVGNQDSAYSQNNNYTHENKPASPPTYDENSRQHDNTQSAPTVTDGITTRNIPSVSTNDSNSPNTTATLSQHQDHNKVQTSSGGKTNLENKEPYWGDIPSGTGVYNGVIGHGSNEATGHQTATRDHSTKGNTGVYNSVTGHGSNDLSGTQRSAHEQHTTTPGNTGVYNGVTGHGSNEISNQQRSADDRHITSENSGSYNSPIRQSSNESATRPGSIPDQINSANDSLYHQRSPQLTNITYNTAGNKRNDVDENNRNSHFKEELGGAGAIATGGYAAHELSSRSPADQHKQQPLTNKTERVAPQAAIYGQHESKPVVASGDDSHARSRREKEAGMAAAGATTAWNDDHKSKVKDDHKSKVKDDHKPKVKDEKPKESGESKLHALLHPFSHKKEEGGLKEREEKATHSSGVHKSANERSLPHSDHAATPVDTIDSNLPTKQPYHIGDENAAKKDSNLGYYGGIAAATGAGVYGGHKYANRDSTEHSSAQGTNVSPSTTSHNTTREAVRSGTPQIGGNGLGHTTRSEQPHQEKQYDMFAHGVSGVSTSGLKHSDNTRSSPSHKAEYNSLSDGTPSGIATGGSKSSYDNAHSSPSQGGEYNTLSDGTPSGIATGDNKASRTARAEQPRHEKYDMPSQGTSSDVSTGIASSGAKQLYDNTRSSPSHKEDYNTLSHDTPSGVATGDSQDSQDIGRTSSDSSRGGQYNVLSSGTPSGINLEQAHSHSHSHTQSSTVGTGSSSIAGNVPSFSDRRQQEKPSAFLSNSPTSSSRPGQSQYEAKDAANSGQVIRKFEMSAQAAALKGSDKKSGDKVNPDFAGGAGNEMSTGTGVGSGRKITHHCTKCGEENDITDYLRT
jgi:hypothetical protein